MLAVIRTKCDAQLSKAKVCRASCTNWEVYTSPAVPFATTAVTSATIGCRAMEGLKGEAIEHQPVPWSRSFTPDVLCLLGETKCDSKPAKTTLTLSLPT